MSVTEAEIYIHHCQKAPKLRQAEGPSRAAGAKNGGNRDYGTYDLLVLRKVKNAEMAWGLPDPCPEFPFHPRRGESFFADPLPPELSGQVYDDMQQVLDEAQPLSSLAYDTEVERIRGVHQSPLAANGPACTSAWLQNLTKI